MLISAWDCVAQVLGTLRSDDGNGNENFEKAMFDIFVLALCVILGSKKNHAPYD